MLRQHVRWIEKNNDCTAMDHIRNSGHNNGFVCLESLAIRCGIAGGAAGGLRYWNRSFGRSILWLQPSGGYYGCGGIGSEQGIVQCRSASLLL